MKRSPFKRITRIATRCRDCLREPHQTRFKEDPKKRRCDDCIRVRTLSRPKGMDKNKGRIESPAHLKWVAKLPCCVQDTHCRGDVVAHHVRTAANSGTGLKPDDCRYTIPLCHTHHMQLHDMGNKSFQMLHGVNLMVIAEMVFTTSVQIGLDNQSAAVERLRELRPAS